MSSPARPDVVPAGPVGIADDGQLLNRFHYACLVFQRTRQLRNGGRPRLEVGSHKHVWVAMREVSAGMVPWNVVGAADPGPGG